MFDRMTMDNQTFTDSAFNRQINIVQDKSVFSLPDINSLLCFKVVQKSLRLLKTTWKPAATCSKLLTALKPEEFPLVVLQLPHAQLLSCIRQTGAKSR